MRRVTLYVLLSCVASSTAAAGSTWSNLWSTPEQQAQHLLDSRQAAAAAPLFKDPRRRGYAQLRAGQFAQAAKSLAPLHDADSLYNRGNALAHTGQLQDALAAYDAALKQSPGNRDIVHNRDLVAHALQKQQQQSRQGNKGSGAGSGKGGQQGGTGQQQGGSAGGQQGGAGQQHGGSADGQRDAARDQQGSAGGQQTGSNGQQQSGSNTGENQGTRQAQAGSSPQTASAAPAGNPQQASAAQAPSQQRQGVGSQPAGTTQGDDSAPGSSSTARAGSRPTAPEVAMRGEGSKGVTQPPPPRSEQSLALDQWLRGIPDDSGELLRRKFMIEHMMKQQEKSP